MPVSKYYITDAHGHSESRAVSYWDAYLECVKWSDCIKSKQSFFKAKGKGMSIIFILLLPFMTSGLQFPKELLQAETYALDVAGRALARSRKQFKYSSSTWSDMGVSVAEKDQTEHSDTANYLMVKAEWAIRTVWLAMS